MHNLSRVNVAPGFSLYKFIDCQGLHKLFNELSTCSVYKIYLLLYLEIGHMMLGSHSLVKNHMSSEKADQH